MTIKLFIHSIIHVNHLAVNDGTILAVILHLCHLCHIKLNNDAIFLNHTRDVN